MLCVPLSVTSELRATTCGGPTTAKGRAEPPPVAEPAVAANDGKETLVWIQGSPSSSEDTWHLGHEGGDWFGAPYSSWDCWLQAESYVGKGATKEHREDVESYRDGCKTIAAWAREDGYIVPPHPVYGEV